MTQFDKRNISMMMDFYEMTMSYGYFNDHDTETKVVFDVFYRQNPDGGGFAIFAGLEQVIEYDVASKDEIDRISNALKENETYNSAMWIGQDAFSHIYRYMMRYIRSYNGTAYKVLFNATPVNGEMTKVEFTEYMN